ncbi:MULTISPECIES: hybrid sensor histidine kinase/response regulator [Dyella]|uniref:histidine kinase n=2 Tax=Dyella TaxID=231454 RepID=A0A4R0YZ86_9GAMM|nr:MULTISPECIES: hybrid sensor histidine kinase/response regulator [Dyella]TBR40292.1 hybrid sensor histidine kinase/response regulator [Dyella terrae]TCI12126.1 hybrid sensor histidine kinase/response regulator [Dyella soli]
MLSSLLLGIALLASPATAQSSQGSAPVASDGMLATPQFRSYGTANGLPSSSVYTVAQGPDGAMWFGTKGGIARYDGVGFRVFRHLADDPNSLHDNGISTLMVDKSGHLWAGGLEAGLNRYDPITERFQHWGHDPSNPDSLSSDKVWVIKQTYDGSIWVGTAHGLDRMRLDGHSFDHIAAPGPDNDAAGFGAVAALFMDARKRLWIGSAKGVFMRDEQGNIRPIPQEHSSEPIDAWRIEGDGDEIRIASARGLLTVGADGIARMFCDDIAQINVLSSARDTEGRLWIGTQRGLYLQEAPGQAVKPVANQPLLAGNLPGTWVWKVQPDREGGLWIALFDGGVAYLAPGWNNVSRFTHVPDEPTSLRDSVATALARGRDGRVWVGARSGRVDKLDPHTGAVEHVLSDMRGDVVGMTEDAQRRLWIAVQGGLYRYADGKLDRVSSADSGMAHPLEVELGPDGKLYARTFSEGLFRVDQETLAVTPVAIKPADEKARWGSQLTLKRGVFWYASDGGLRRLDAGNDHFEPVPGISNERAVDAFDFDKDGIWLARPDGLEHYHHQGDAMVLDRKVDAHHGWPSINVVDLAVDDEGRVWMLGRDGMWRFDTETGQFRSFGLQDGLTNGEFFRGFARMPDGNIYAPTMGGVVGFNPNQVDAEVHAPQLALTGLGLRRQGVLHAQPVSHGVLELGWRDRNLNVEARVFSYVNINANRYRFRLGGLDADWVDTGNRGEREFANLEAGDYLLDVMAAGADGEWGKLSTPLRIHVEAAPWVRWWAWCIYVALVAMLAWVALLIWRRRLAQRHQIQLAEQRSRLAEQASAAKTQFLATLSHEIRTPMTGVMGMAELLLSTDLDKQQLEYAEAIRRSGSMLLKLLNDALDLARIEAGKLSLDVAPFDPRALVEEVALLERGQALSKGLQFNVDMADSLPPRVLGDALRIKQILLNLANNALKFTEHGSVTLRATFDERGLHLSVIDTGPGIPEASQARLFQRFEQATGPQRRVGSGLGLAICRELVALMGGHIELESRVAHGSSFHVRLPLDALHAPEPVHAPAAARAPASGGLDILLVEDDVIVAAVVRGMLEKQGHHVIFVGNGLAAMTELTQKRFDVALLDLDLPGVDGFQIARLIRQRETGVERMPIVAITARSGGDEEVHARNAGMDAFLRKPLTGEQLADVLAEMTGERA